MQNCELKAFRGGAIAQARIPSVEIEGCGQNMGVWLVNNASKNNIEKNDDIWNSCNIACHRRYIGKDHATYHG